MSIHESCPNETRGRNLKRMVSEKQKAHTHTTLGPSTTKEGQMNPTRTKRKLATGLNPKQAMEGTRLEPRQ